MVAVLAQGKYPDGAAITLTLQGRQAGRKIDFSCRKICVSKVLTFYFADYNAVLEEELPTISVSFSFPPPFI